MKSYVVGLVFQGNDVVLIRKTHPAWQCGKLNGVGGRMEPGETPQQAMAREFEEEAGVNTEPDSWRLFLHAVYGASEIFFLCRQIHFPRECPITMTDEIVCRVNVTSAILGRNVDTGVEIPVLPNLRWIIAMAVAEPDRVYDVQGEQRDFG